MLFWTSATEAEAAVIKAEKDIVKGASEEKVAAEVAAAEKAEAEKVSF